MKKKIYIGLLLLTFLFLFSPNSFSQKIPYMSLIDSKEMKYMDNAELSIEGWREYQYDTKNKYGESSKKFLSTMFDTVIFGKYYNRFFKYCPAKLHVSFTKDAKKNNMDLSDYPMIGISYQQCIDYCKWRTEKCNYKVKGVSKIVFSLPSKQDYAKAVSHAKITNKSPLSKLINKKRGKIKGITDNVQEYTIDNSLNSTNIPTGFRCVATIQKD